MEVQSSFDDCYFYYYSSCTKGEECPFRHCEAALGTETVCSLWREGRCYRGNCKFRHMESRIKRSTIPCYWENQPGGCRKPHCVFFHAKFRPNAGIVENQGLILPVSTQVAVLTTNQITSSISSVSNLQLPSYSPMESSLSNESLTISPTSQPIEPFVVSFDEGEESDAESVSSTPVKSTSTKTDSAATKSKTAPRIEEKNFGIKTLEQLRIEKMHRESEFYKQDDSHDKVIADNSHDVNRISKMHEESVMLFYPEYCDPEYEDMQMEHKSESNMYTGSYPPDSSDILVLSIDSSQDNNLLTSENTPIRKDNAISSRNSRDLRCRITKTIGGAVTKNNTTQEKRTLSLKRPHDNTEEDSLDFKIKTLDEIRREKEKKLEILRVVSPPPPYENSNAIKHLENNNYMSDASAVNQRKIRKLFRDPFVAHKEDLIVQKSLEQNLRIKNTPKLEQNGSVKVIHAEEVCARDAEPMYTKTEDLKANSVLPTDVSSKNKQSANFLSETKLDSTDVNYSHSLKNVSKTATESGTSHNTSPRKSQRPIIRRNSKLLSELPFQKTEQTEDRPSSTLSIDINNFDSETSSNKIKSRDTITNRNELVSSSELEKKIDNIDDNEEESSPDESIQEIPTPAKDQVIKSEHPDTKRSTSVDEFDHLFLNDSELILEEGDDNSDKKAEDLFLEIEQMLES